MAQALLPMWTTPNRPRAAWSTIALVTFFVSMVWWKRVSGADLRFALEEVGSGINGNLTPGGSGSGRSNPSKVPSICALIILLSLSASFSGLGLGLMSLDLIGLEIVVAAGEDEHATAKERRQSEAARKIISVRKQGNLLLTTLLMGNVSVNSLTSILMADMTSGLAGFLFSTVLIVIFGEIVPQAVCTKHALEIGGRVIPFVKVLIAIFYVFAKPVSLVLDKSLGEDIGTVFTKRQLTEMIEIHEKESMISTEEGGILRGAMMYRSKMAKTIMTPLDKLFMLPVTAVLNQATIQKILESGFSRIPVYGAGPNDIISTIYTRDLVFVDPNEQVLLSNFIHVFGRDMHHVAPECTLGVLLQSFKMGSTHLALVKHVEFDELGKPVHKLGGIVTLEDVLEEILQDEILDETEVVENNKKSKLKRRLSCLYGQAGRLSRADLTTVKGGIENVELAQYLQETNPIFLSSNLLNVPINTLALAEVLSNCPIIEFAGSKSEKIFEQGEETFFSVIVLEGKLQVDSSERRVEVGRWAVLSAECLTQENGNHRSDITVRTLAGVRTKILRLTRAEFQVLLT